MDLQLRGKRVLITGASKGIGLACAETFADEGAEIVITARSGDALRANAEQIQQRTGVAVDTIAADLSTADGVASVAEACGAIDVLVNNAGAIPPGTVLDVDDRTWREAWDLKVFGYIGLSRSLYPRLKERSGVIVNVIGAAGERMPAEYIAGATGNASLMAFTKAMARQAHGDGMRVVAVNPGPVSTDRNVRMLRDRAARELGDAERWGDLLADMPYGRAATAEEIGAAVAFLASPRSAYTNGAVLTIDGGG